MINSTVITKLYSQRRNMTGGAEHFTLQVAGGIPGSLSAGGCIDRENQPRLAVCEGANVGATLYKLRNISSAGAFRGRFSHGLSIVPRRGHCP